MSLLFLTPMYLNAQVVEQKTPRNFNVQGTIYDPTGAVYKGLASIRFQILNSTSTCVLYEETQSTIDTTNSNGSFSVDLGVSGTRSNRITNGSSLSRSIFENNKTVNVTGCGLITIPQSADRKLRLFFDTGSGMYQMSPDINILSLPYAQIAEYADEASYLNGKAGSDYLFTNTGSVPSSALTQSNLEALLANATNFTNLLNLATSGSAPSSGSANITGGTIGGSTIINTTGAITTTNTITGASISVTTLSSQGTRYYELTNTNYILLKAPNSLATTFTLNLPDTPGLNNQVLTTDGSGNLSWSTPSTSTVSSVAGRTGAVTLSSSDISGLGALAGKSAITSADLSNASIEAIKLSQMGASSGQVMKWNGSAWVASDDSSSSGTVTDVTASSPLSSSGGSTPNINITQANGTNSGYLSSNDWTVFNSKLSDFSTLTSADITAKYGYTPLANFSSITSSDIAAGSGFVNGGNSFGSSASIGTNDNQDLNLKTNGSTKMTVLANGNVGIGTNTPWTKLSVEGSGSPQAASIQAANTADAAGEKAYIRSYVHGPNSGNPVFRAVVNGVTEWSFGIDNSDNDKFKIGNTSDVGTSFDQFTIDTTGKVGIGTTNPTQKLDVQGTISSSAVSDDSTALSLNNSAISNRWNIYNLPSTDVSSPKALMFENCDNGPCERKLTMKTTGQLGLGVVAPTAKFHIGASDGTAFTAPLKLTAGTNLSTPEDGAMEFDGTNLYFTSSGTRRTIASSSSGTLTGNVSAINNSIGSITMTPSAGNSVIINQTTTSTNSTNGALIVSGGVGIAENLNVGGNIASAGIISAQTSIRSPILYGSSSSSGDLTLDSTSHGTKGNIILAPNGGNVGIGTASPMASLDIGGPNTSRNQLWIREGAGGGLTAAAGKGLKIEYSTGVDAARIEAYDYGASIYKNIIIAGGGGNVGIGTTSPNSTLSIGTNIGSGYAITANSPTAYGVNIQTAEASPSANAAFWVRTTPDSGSTVNTLFRVQNNGNVGIGTSSPVTKFQILDSAPTIRLEESTTGGNKRFEAGVTSTGLAWIGANQSAQDLAFQTVGTEKMRITSDGKVGVGTTSPTWKLQIKDQYPYLAFEDTDNANGSMGTITYNQDGNFYFDADNPNTATSGGFHFRADGATKYLMTLENSGNVGIGTTTPIAKLDVNGSINISQDASLRSAGNWIIGQNSTTNTIHIGSTAASPGNDIRFDTLDVGAGAMIIKSTGNVGIGTLSPYSKFDVMNTYAGTTAASFRAMNGAYGQVEINNSNTATDVAFLSLHSGGDIAWQQGIKNSSFVISQTGGMAKSYNDINRLTITNTGNVGIGTTSPAVKLDVVGDLKVSGQIYNYNSPTGTLHLGNQNWTWLLNDATGTSYDSTEQGVIISDAGTKIIKNRTPIDPNAIYKLEVTIKKLSGNGTVYIGADSLNENFSSVQTDLAQSYNYFAAAGDPLSVGSEKTYVGFISGYNTPAESNPNKFDPNTNYFNIVIITNYGGSGNSLVKSVHLTKVEGTATLANGNVGIGTTSPSNLLSNIPTSVGYTNVGDGGGTGQNSSSLSWASQAGGYSAAIVNASSAAAANGLQVRTAGVGSSNKILTLGTGTASSANSDVMVVQGDGYVGIGTISPISPLDIRGGPSMTGGWNRTLRLQALHPAIQLKGTSQETKSAWIEYDDATSTNSMSFRIGGTDDDVSTATRVMSISGSGNVGIGIVTPSYKLDVQGGGVNASGGYTQTSDIRLKTNIEYLDSNQMLHKISNLHGINYNWKNKEKNGSDKQIGLIAQEVEKVFPEAVKKNSEGFLSVSYSNLVAPVIEAIKQLFKITENQSRQMASFEERLNQIEAKNQRLEKENKELRKELCSQQLIKKDFCK